LTAKYIVDNSHVTFASAWMDIVKGFGLYPLWGRLGWSDILQRYRRSVLGPIWLTISMGVLVGSLGFLYASLFKLDLEQYLPFLTIGFVLWQLISGILIDGCIAFTSAEGIIKQINLPLSVHVYRLMWRNLLTFLHNAIVIAIVMIIFKLPVTLNSLFILGGMFFLIANGFWIALFLGLICARYRDLNPTVASVVQLSFFVTPIIWDPGLLPDKQFILLYNPFYHFGESIRAPLLGDSVPLETWLVLLSITLFGWMIIVPLFGAMRRQLVYWL